MATITDIRTLVYYEDESGQTQMVTRDAKTFESAAENLGKLERFIEKLNRP